MENAIVGVGSVVGQRARAILGTFLSCCCTVAVLLNLVVDWFAFKPTNLVLFIVVEATVVGSIAWLVIARRPIPWLGCATQGRSNTRLFENVEGILKRNGQLHPMNS
jgi:hypothetical protein